MIPSDKRIRTTIARLRKIIDAPETDVITARIAYAVENALRWSIEDTVSWFPPEQDILKEADILKIELQEKKKGKK